MLEIGALSAGALALGKYLLSLTLPSVVVKAIGVAATCFAKALGLGIDDDKNVEEIGNRALQAEEKGITPDKFENKEAWLKEIQKDDWGYDPQKNAELDSVEKMAKGIEVVAGLCVEKLPLDIPIMVLFNVLFNNYKLFTPELMTELGKLANNNVDDFRKIMNYVIGEMDDSVEIRGARQILVGIQKSINPLISNDEAMDFASKMFNLEK